MRTTFKDPELQAMLDRDGFVVVDLVPPEVIDDLQRAYQRLDSGIDTGYYPSLMSTDLEYKAETHAVVRDILWPYLGAMFTDYEPLLGVFMVKHPGPDTEVPPHQDWIIADESERPSMSCWLPLTPVDDATGRMAVLPGSHRWLNGLRGSPEFPTQWNAVHEEVRTELMQPVDIAVGQAMVYDIRVLHGTPPNRSASTRVVTSIYGIPTATAPVHYYRSPEGVVSGYNVPSNFCTTFDIGDVPDGEPFVTIEDYTIDEFTFEEIRDRYQASPAGQVRATTPA